MSKQINLPLRTVDILKEFTMSPERTQRELQSILGISTPTTFRAVDQLRNLGLLSSGNEVSTPNRGRPATRLQLNPDGFCVFALVIRSEESQLYLVDALGCIRQSVIIRVSADEPYQAALNLYKTEILRLLPYAREKFAMTPGIGISFAGRVDPESGSITAPSRFPDWRQKPIAYDLSTCTGLPCSINNDATSLTQATIWFSPKNIPESFALLYFDFGLGSGYCFQGQTYPGQNHVSAGLAHTNLFGWSQETCHCGQKGCLETVLSIPAVIKLAHQKGLPQVGVERSQMITALHDIEGSIQDGDGNLQQILEQAGERAARVGMTLSRILDLPAIVYAGGLTEISPTFWESINSEMLRQTESATTDVGWWRLTDLLENSFPEALGATAVALAALYHSRRIMLLKEKVTD